MFTPPPSPLPMPRDLGRANGVDEKLVDEKLEDLDLGSLADDVAQRKAEIGRRIKWAIVIVPALFVLATLFSRVVVYSGRDPWPPFDILDGPLLRTHHRRSPQQSGNGQNPPTSTLPPQTQQTIPPIPSSPPTLPTPFPAPLTQANDFTTQGCQAFFRNMTQQESFLACRPFSLLIQFSSTFLNAQSNLTLLNTLMWGTCNTRIPADQCAANMNWFANDIQNACRVEFSRQNDLVQSTLAGLQAYTVMRTVGCLADQKQDSTQDSYCYVNAVQARNPSDLYYYSVPLGTMLPNGTHSSCNACTKSVLNVYEEAHKQGGVPSLDRTYDDTIYKTQLACGLTYISAVSGAEARWNGQASAVWTALVGTMFVMGILGMS